ncbi:MAG: hypothetical protein LBF16_04725 [Pseudomonadales bacterium]|jgi:hypothetical protein|nr:hypothetical protein [Pseudomonadales bacterium]
MKNEKVEFFTLHNDKGQSILDADLARWNVSQEPLKRIYGPFIRRSWQVNGEELESSRPGNWCLLPDASGFILFENDWRPDNSVVLDAYGNERMRLMVPKKLLPGIDDSSMLSTCFLWLEPSGKEGQCRLIGSVGEAMAGDFGCDFDYVNGVFLKCYKVRI